jgi:hypothetical protein
MNDTSTKFQLQSRHGRQERNRAPVGAWSSEGRIYHRRKDRDYNRCNFLALLSNLLQYTPRVSVSKTTDMYMFID